MVLCKLSSSTLHRQLPDLPNQAPNHHLLEGPNPPRRSSSLLSHDGTSELYATVGEVPNPDDLPSHSSKSSGAYNAKKFKEKGGGSSKGPQPGTSKGTKGEPSSDSETYGNSAAHHPYAKLKRKDVAEHPYARVRSGSTGTGGDEETDTDNYDTPQPYAQTGSGVAARLAQAGASSSRSGHHHRQSRDVVDGSANVSSANAEAASGNPVPPRRMGRGWRRGSHPPAQAYVSNNQCFTVCSVNLVAIVSLLMMLCIAGQSGSATTFLRRLTRFSGIHEHKCERAVVKYCTE